MALDINLLTEVPSGALADEFGRDLNTREHLDCFLIGRSVLIGLGAIYLSAKKRDMLIAVEAEL